METKILIDLDEGSRLNICSTHLNKASVDTHEVSTSTLINLATSLRSCLSDSSLREVAWDTSKKENKDKEEGSSFFVLSFTLSGIHFTLYSQTLEQGSPEQTLLRELCLSQY